MHRIRNDPGSAWRRLQAKHIFDTTRTMKNKPAKITKGVALRAPMAAISYKQIRHGFWFARQDESKFFALPTLQEIERTNFKFWRSM